MQDGLIGNTPLVALRRLLGDDERLRLFAKVEGANAGGSLKDRPARRMLTRAVERGEVGPETVVVESSSGNMGIGLALTARRLGLRFVCVVDPKTTTSNLEILEAYGAEIELVDAPDRATGGYLKARLDRVQELLLHHPDSYWPNQYTNPDNAAAHHETMREIVDDLGAAPDYLFLAASTCGTLRGCADYTREHGLATEIVAVDAAGSIIFGGAPGDRLIPGHGAAVRPALYRDDLAHRVVTVTDLDCVLGCHWLLDREGILAGGSSGGVVSALSRVHDELPPDSTCVVLLCDRGERYLDTVFSRPWIHEHFGAVDEGLGRRPETVAVGVG